MGIESWDFEGSDFIQMKYFGLSFKKILIAQETS